MNSRAILTAMLFAGAIATARLVAQVPAPQPQMPAELSAADPAQCAVERRAAPGFAGNLPMVGSSAGAAVAGQATGTAIDGVPSAGAAQSPRCAN